MSLRTRSIENIEVSVDVADDCQISTEDADTVALDAAMMSILLNRNLKGDLKCFQYYKTIEWYLYKRDPAFETLQFTFEVQTDNIGDTVVIIKAGKKKKPLFNRLLKFLPSVVAPGIGALIHALLH